MISVKCPDCAGEMSVGLKGELICPYCGSKMQLSDKELENYKTFRMNMLQYLRAQADNKADQKDRDSLQNYCENVVYDSADGVKISIDYLFFC